MLLQSLSSPPRETTISFGYLINKQNSLMIHFAEKPSLHIEMRISHEQFMYSVDVISQSFIHFNFLDIYINCLHSRPCQQIRAALINFRALISK